MTEYFTNVMLIMNVFVLQVSKAVVRLASDKCEVVRARAMGAIAIIATKSKGYASVPLDALLPTASKGLADHTAAVHLAGKYLIPVFVSSYD